MHKTAIRRNSISAPVRWLIQNGFVKANESWLNFGEGYSYMDTEALQAIPFDVFSDSPAVRCPQRLAWTYDNAYAGYVLNVIDDPRNRLAVLRRLLDITTKACYIAVRSDPVKGLPFGDGVLTKAGTFQKRYTQASLMQEFPDLRMLHNGGHFLLAWA